MNGPLLKAASALALAIGIAAPAQAIDIPGTGLSLSGSAGVVTDYRFRGVSLSNGKVSKQASLSVAHESGVYVGGWIGEQDIWDDDPATGFSDGSDLEVDATLGWSKEVVPTLTLDANVTYYVYPGVTGPTNYAEASTSAMVSLGIVDAKVGASFFPDQPAVPDSGHYYFAEASAHIPLLFSLTGHVGHQLYGPGFGATADYWEWSATASKSFGPLRASLAYIDTDLPAGNRAGATVVASVGFAF